jgi:hypothetical protein
MKLSYIKEKSDSFFGDQYTAMEWVCMKVLFSIQFSLIAISAIFEYSSIPYPSGILGVADFSWLLYTPFKILLAGILILLMVFYLMEFRMPLTTLLIFIISVFIFSIKESNGVMSKKGLLSMIFFAQFFAYFFARLKIGGDLFKNRVQFSVQTIAAVYTLAAISKIVASGISWVNSGPALSVQILKQFYCDYATTGDLSYQRHGIQSADWILHHLITVKILLVSTLLIEAFSFLSMINKKCAFVFGLLLLSVHIGTKVLMNIFFAQISWPMITFLINPLFIICWLLQKKT